MRLACAAALALLAAACAGEQAQPVPYTGARAPGPAPAEMTGGLVLPPGQNRVPVVILSHDIRGRRDAQLQPYIDGLKAMGVAVFILNHYEPRGIDSTLRPAERPRLTAMDMAEDAFGALDTLARNPRIDPRRAAIVGFGEGGGAAALITAHAVVAGTRPANAPRFALHVALYPDCGFRFGNRATTRAPIRIILAGRDAWTGTAPCTDLADYLKAAGADITVSTYAEARHGFDDPPGALARDARGENIAACVWVEQSDGTWRERRSGTTGAAPFRRDAPDPALTAYRTGREACRTLGTETQGDAALRQRGVGETLGYVRQFLVNPPAPR